MPNQQDDSERTGRLYLWASALSECLSLLKLAQRAERSAKLLADLAAERCSKGLPPDLGNFGTSEFGGYPDLFQTTQSCRMLAVVVFCQVFNRGDPSAGKATANLKPFRDSM